jgi:hypothetical protein
MTGSTLPSSEEPQGLSLVDYELELEVDFPPEMVLEMQEGVVCKAQRMVIERASLRFFSRMKKGLSLLGK